MQPIGADRRLPAMRRFFRLTAAAAVAATLLVAPTASVHACSCAGPGTPAEIVAGSDVALVGSVVDRAPAGAGDVGNLVAYAFAVERASVPVAAVVEVRAVGGDGGASCGIEFGEGQRWFVSASARDGGLETNLCAGNVLLDGPDGAAEAARFEPLLPMEPRGDDTTPSAPFPIASIVAGIVVLAAVAVAVVAFSRGQAR